MENPVEAPVPKQPVRALLPAILGPLAMGLCVAFRLQTLESLELALLLPIFTFGLLLVTVPGLYIGSALVGRAPSIVSLWKTTAEALSRAGVLLLGCAPATLLLVATATTTDLTSLFVGLPFAIAAVAFLRLLHNGLYREAEAQETTPRFLFVGWAGVTLLIGVRLFWIALHNA
ncbi:MAG: hypothetical protein IT434_19220 [Phycisphaerales bacterium]|nr:hypothetical protein [Phycisphaerales bacterium]